MGGVGRAGRDKGGHRASLGDALFEDLAVFGLFVVSDDVFVNRLVELAEARIDPELAEEAAPCRRCAIRRDDRDD